MSSELMSPFLEASFFAILSWKQGNHALEWTIFNQYWRSLIFTNLESSGDGQYDSGSLINFSADYHLEIADWKKVARVAQSTSFTGRFPQKYAIKMKNGNNKHHGKSLELSFGVEKVKIGPEMRLWQLFSHNHPEPPHK